MNSLSFQKFKGQLSERRYGGPKKGKEYKNLSPKMKAAVDDVYSMIDKTSDPIIGKVEGIIANPEGAQMEDDDDTDINIGDN